jgi:hypothetical protein
MDARTAERIESAMDAGAATLLAAAVGYALHALAMTETALAGGVAAALGLSFVGLRRVPPGARSAQAQPAGTPVADLLAEADRSLAHAEDELVLDDILAALNPDSRVVRLFDGNPIPTRGGIQAGIDGHLDSRDAVPDASRALHEALADLRRSLN